MSAATMLANVRGEIDKAVAVCRAPSTSFGMWPGAADAFKSSALVVSSVGKEFRPPRNAKKPSCPLDIRVHP